MVDVGWGDLIDYSGDDPRTRSVILYMESVGNARAFLSAAREVALTKPIIAIKAGRTEAAAKAASSHTGALTGSDDVLDAAFRRCGVLRVDSIGDLFHMAEVLAKQPRPAGPRLTVVTNAGGPGVLAADALILHGGKLCELSPETVQSLDRILPPHWSHNNPIDILGDALPDRYAQAAEIVAQDRSSDGLLVILAPQAMTDPTMTAERVSHLPRLARNPILASWMGGAQAAAGIEILSRANIPTFHYPDTAARVFAYMWSYSDNLRGLYETPALAAGPEETPRDTVTAAEIVRRARDVGRTLLTEFESKQVLQAYGIPTVATQVAESEEAAAKCARELGYPVVLKLHSETITHKAQAGGVRLNLTDENAVRRAFGEIESAVREKAGLPAEASAQAGAGHFLGVTVQPMVSLGGFELILGSSTDAQFGPVLVFGLGGQWVEVFRDRALALPPLNTTLARRMMERTRIFSALATSAGPVDLAALEQLMVRFSQLVVGQRAVKEIDINPLLASPAGLLALDARLVLHDPAVPDDELPPLAIRPYPTQYVAAWTMKDGTLVTLRPIRPEDEPLMVDFHERLSEQTVYRRYFQALGLAQRTAHERLTRLCFIDFDRQMALVAERKVPETGAREILGVGRLSKLLGTDRAEFALLIVDSVQRQGLGTELLRRLLEIARNERIHRMQGEILVENFPMQRLCEKLGFRLRHSPEQSIVEAEMEL
jgi:acetyltransferase